MNAIDTLPALAESPTEHWKRPPPQGRGDASRDEIYLGVGYCLSSWEFLETCFAHLFARFVESDSWAAARAYGSIASNNGRREALEKAAEVYFFLRPVKDEDQQYFGKLMRHFRESAARRNEIAHGMVVGFEVDSHGVGAFLVPPNYNSRKTQHIGATLASSDRLGEYDYRYTSTDLRHFNKLFHDFHNPVIAYHVHLTKKYGHAKVLR